MNAAEAESIYLPGLDEVPVREVLLQVVGVGRAGPVDQVEVNVVHVQILQRGSNALLDTVVPWVVQLGGDPDLIAGHAGILDSSANLGLVAVGQSSVDVAVASEQSILDSHADFVGLRLPGSKANGRNLSARVKGEGLPERQLC